MLYLAMDLVRDKNTKYKALYSRKGRRGWADVMLNLDMAPVAQKLFQSLPPLSHPSFLGPEMIWG